jgi:hypothetical protein
VHFFNVFEFYAISLSVLQFGQKNLNKVTGFEKKRIKDLSQNSSNLLLHPPRNNHTDHAFSMMVFSIITNENGLATLTHDRQNSNTGGRVLLL